MIIYTIKVNKKAIILTTIILIIITLILAKRTNTNIETSINEKSENEYIKWVDFNATNEILRQTAKMDIESHQKNEEIKYNWIEMLSYLACKNGNNFTNSQKKQIDELVEKIKKGETIEEITKDMKYYEYYYESFSAILGGFIGNYEIEIQKGNEKKYEKKYGIKAFLPIAKNYGFSHYDDFGNSRTYGFKRVHLGNDLMGSIGTPIIAVESGTIAHIGWNQYGGWRIGIRSMDSKRYYYYAHLRKDHPYAPNLEEGSVVKAGDVIGYLGMTGYSPKENVNNINVPHLHFGMQLIFDESQFDSPKEIWIDVYQIIEFLKQNKSEVIKSETMKNEYTRKYDMIEEQIFEE